MSNPRLEIKYSRREDASHYLGITMGTKSSSKQIVRMSKSRHPVPPINVKHDFKGILRVINLVTLQTPLLKKWLNVL